MDTNVSEKHIPPSSASSTLKMLSLYPPRRYYPPNISHNCDESCRMRWSGSDCLTAAIKDESTRPDASNSFQRALCPLLVAGQCFALMPVSGLTGHDASTLRFRWCSPRVAYTMLSLVGILYHLYFCLWDLCTAHRITYSACGKRCKPNIGKFNDGKVKGKVLPVLD
jgi:hypothetical protein